LAGTVLPMFAAPAWLPRTVFLVLAALLVPVLMFDSGLAASY